MILAIKENKHWAFIALTGICLVQGMVVMCNPFPLLRIFAVNSGAALAYSGLVSLIHEIKAGKKA